MNTTGALSQKFDRVVTLADSTAKKVGYGSTVTDQERIDILAALKELVDAYEQVGGEVEAAIAKARTFVDVTDGSNLSQALDVMKTRIANAAKAAHKAKQLEADKKFRAGGA
jgi:hypothetical protein